ncbi:MAG: hypothetical protein ABSC06_01605 [Rhodopila sp.]|jgi:hypothetical protein
MLAQVMMERDATKPLRRHVELDDAYLGGGHFGGERGRGAPGAAVRSRYPTERVLQRQRGWCSEFRAAIVVADLAAERALSSF